MSLIKYIHRHECLAHLVSPQAVCWPQQWLVILILKIFISWLGDDKTPTVLLAQQFIVFRNNLGLPSQRQSWDECPHRVWSGGQKWAPLLPVPDCLTTPHISEGQHAPPAQETGQVLLAKPALDALKEGTWEEEPVESSLLWLQGYAVLFRNKFFIQCKTCFDSFYLFIQWGWK